MQPLSRTTPRHFPSATTEQHPMKRTSSPHCHGPSNSHSATLFMPIRVKGLKKEKKSMHSLQPLLSALLLVELCLMVYRGRLDYRVITAPALWFMHRKLKLENKHWWFELTERQCRNQSRDAFMSQSAFMGEDQTPDHVTQFTHLQLFAMNSATHLNEGHLNCTVPCAASHFQENFSNSASSSACTHFYSQDSTDST